MKDNECSQELKTALDKEFITYQLVPPHIHRDNNTEREIQTFKNHFKAGLVLVDPDFPFLEWDQLIPQAELTLNILCTLRIHSQLLQCEITYLDSSTG